MNTLTTLPVPSMSLREMIAAMPLLVTWRNSKGRIMPLHVKSAPGVGKTMLTEYAAKAIARNNPGEPVGYALHNAGIKTPADVGGYTLFDTIDGQKTSISTRPDIFSVQYALICTPATADSPESFETVMCDDNGQPLYWGSTVRGQRLVRGILLMDENDQADVEVRKVLAPLYDEGRVTQHHLPRDVMVWAASNRARDASGAGRGLAFLTNRWAVFEIEPDIHALEAYLNGENILDSVEPLSPTITPVTDERGRVVRNPRDVDLRAHPAISAFMSEMQETLFAGVPSDPNQPFLTGRSLEAFSNLFDIALRLSVADETGAMDPALSFADSFLPRRTNEKIEGVTGDNVMRWRVFQTLGAGVIGAENTSQFLAKLELFDEVPTIAAITKDPKGARVSDKTDAQFITAHLVANGMTPKNGSALMRYAERLSPALYHNVVHNAVSRDGHLLTVPEVGAFLQKHSDSMVRMMQMRAQVGVSRNKS